MAEPPHPSSLGDLARLPPEIRSLIWEFLLPEYEPCLPSTSRESTKIWHNYHCLGTSFLQTPSRFAILFTHPDLYNEIYPKLGEDGVLYISVQHNKYGWFFKDGKESQRPSFNRRFSERFHTVHIDIYAPEKSDPGQLIHLRHKVMHLACGLAGYHSLFSKCAGPYDQPCYQKILNACDQDHGWHRRHSEAPRRIELAFLDDRSSSWFDGSSPQKSSSTNDTSDLELLMSIFYYINSYNTTKFQITLPKKAWESADFSLLASKIKNRMKTSLLLVFQRYESNRKLIIEQTETTFKLDTALDEMIGSTAAHLRRERFKNWYTYTNTMQKLQNAVFRCPRDGKWVSVPLYLRSKVFRVLFPGHGELIYLYDREKELPAILTDPWIEKYPHGIPALSSAVDKEQMSKWLVEASKSPYI